MCYRELWIHGTGNRASRIATRWCFDNGRVDFSKRLDKEKR